MDGISNASAIASLVILGARVAQLCVEYIKAVGNFREDVKAILAEISRLNRQVECLQLLVTELRLDKLPPLADSLVAADTLDSRIHDDQTVLTIEAEITECASTLEAIQKLLSRSSHQGGIKRLLWPLKKETFEGHRKKLSRHKATFTLACTSFSAYLSPILPFAN
jgi:hypothetical protein